MCNHGPKPVIGLIGAIGAGKSTAARCLAHRGGAVIDADSLGHEALRQSEIVQQAVQRWGEGIRKPDGSLDRRAIGRIVFTNPAERAALEAMVFPYIESRCREEIERAMTDPAARFVVLDAAIMLEAGWAEMVDRIVYLDAPRELRLARLAARSAWTDAELTAREAAQWPAEQKQARADAVILNDGNAEQLQDQLDRWLEAWGIGPERHPDERR